MKKKILTLAAVVTLPFILLVMYLLASMASYSNTYDEIVSNMTVANNYNLNFKEEMDESLYKLVVGYVTLDTIETDKSLKNPYTLIDELRSEFTRLTAITTESESKLWLESLLRNIDTLEKRVDDIVDSISAGGRYNENIEKLDNNIYILTELIQDDIQYYIYYQTRYMDKVTDTLQDQIRRFMVVCSVLIGVLIIVVAVSAVMIVSGGTNSLLEYNYLVKKVVFNISVLPVVKIISALFVHGFFVLLAIILYICNGRFPDWYYLQILYYSACVFFLVLGLCYATSAIAVLFRDLNQIIGIGLQVGVWLTPIMWVSESMIGANSLLYKILQLNPVFYIVSGYRDAFIIKRWFFERPVWTLYFWIFAICCFLFGNWIFKRLRVHFADVL